MDTGNVPHVCQRHGSKAGSSPSVRAGWHYECYTVPCWPCGFLTTHPVAVHLFSRSSPSSNVIFPLCASERVSERPWSPGSLPDLPTEVMTP